MLDLYISERVKELTKGKQSPVTQAPGGVQDFPLVILGGGNNQNSLDKSRDDTDNFSRLQFFLFISRKLLTPYPLFRGFIFWKKDYETIHHSGRCRLFYATSG